MNATTLMLLEGVQSETRYKIRSGYSDKTTTGVDAENKLNAFFRNKYRIRLADHGILYPQALYNDLVF